MHGCFYLEDRQAIIQRDEIVFVSFDNMDWNAITLLFEFAIEPIDRILHGIKIRGIVVPNRRNEQIIGKSIAMRSQLLDHTGLKACQIKRYLGENRCLHTIQ